MGAFPLCRSALSLRLAVMANADAKLLVISRNSSNELATSCSGAGEEVGSYMARAEAWALQRGAECSPTRLERWIYTQKAQTRTRAAVGRRPAERVRAASAAMSPAAASEWRKEAASRMLLRNVF